MGSFTPAEIVSNYADAGVKKVTRPLLQMLLVGILAGAMIALGSAATNTAAYGISDPWTARTICALLFPFGLGMVLIMGADLFTGNCLITITVLEKKCSIAQMARNLVVIFCANFIGAVLVAAGCALFGQMNYSDGALAVYTIKVAATKCGISFQNGLVSGILCNFLVSMGVLMSMSGKDTTGRILGAYLPVCFFVLCGFEHCVANMYYISAGLLAKSVPAYAQLAASAGIDLAQLNLSNFLLGNLLPVTLGNIIGGGGLGCIMWYCNAKKK